MSVALAYRLRGYGTYRPLRHCGDTPAPYACRGLPASRFALPWRAAKVALVGVLPQVPPDAEVLEALRSDLNVPGALVRLRVLLTELDNADTNPRRAHTKSALLASSGMLGLLQQAPQAALAALRSAVLAPSAQSPDDTRIKTLLAEREQARRDRDFAKADALREKLAAAGFMVEDTRTGSVLRPAAKEPA